MSKVDENLLYEMFNDGISSLSFNRYDGSLDYVDFYSHYDTYYDFSKSEGIYWDDVDEDVFDSTKYYLVKLLESADYYTDGGTTYLQLHDNHTFLAIESEIDDYEISAILGDIFEEFKAQTGQNAYGLGRSGRHICVDFTLDNLENYESLKETALDLEREFINTVNAYGE